MWSRAMFDIPEATAEAMRDAAREASLAAAKAFGFGGDTWSVSRPAGDGVTTDVTFSAAASVTGYAYRQRPGATGQALPQTAVLNDQWWFILLTGSVQQGDVLTSAEDGRRIIIRTLEPWYEYTRCEIVRDVSEA
jgi:hypothetical protein